MKAGDAKGLGNTVPLRDDWDRIKDSVMWDLLKVKFHTPELRSKLMLTKPHELVEGNDWHDLYWGKCSCAVHHLEGQNKLGIFLMQVRDQLFNENPEIFDCTL
jgi:hypothetical protein